MKRREALKSGLFASAIFSAPFMSGKNIFDENKTILVTGAHPDDPETGCGGTIARLVKEGHAVKVLYFTKGEAGIRGKTHDEAAAIREGEVRNACKILGSEPLFYGQIDGSTFVNRDEYNKMQKLISDIDPGLVFTQWPVDTHPDHRHLSLLVYGAWLSMNRRFPLYYYEVLTGQQTQTFSPTDFADITDFEPVKRKACYAHASQVPDDFYNDHLQMSLFRGLQCGQKHAEAFTRQTMQLNQFE